MPTQRVCPLCAVDYARYSADIQSDTSIDDQARVCQERIRFKGWAHGRS